MKKMIRKWLGLKSYYSQEEVNRMIDKKIKSSFDDWVKVDDELSGCGFLSDQVSKLAKRSVEETVNDSRFIAAVVKRLGELQIKGEE